LADAQANGDFTVIIREGDGADTTIQWHIARPAEEARPLRGGLAIAPSAFDDAGD
jgi:hypothetical protein